MSGRISEVRFGAGPDSCVVFGERLTVLGGLDAGGRAAFCVALATTLQGLRPRAGYLVHDDLGQRVEVRTAPPAPPTLVMEGDVLRGPPDRTALPRARRLGPPGPGDRDDLARALPSLVARARSSAPAAMTVMVVLDEWFPSLRTRDLWDLLALTARVGGPAGQIVLLTEDPFAIAWAERHAGGGEIVSRAFDVGSLR